MSEAAANGIAFDRSRVSPTPAAANETTACDLESA
jgi:hypothetical protein